ncbi:hypothetical protein AHAS_Ahas04G0141800 [Arachis hypogaea]
MGKKITKQVGRVKQACHLEQTSQKCIGMARQKLGVARWFNIPERKIEDHQRGVARQEQGVARELVTRRAITIACHFVSKVWHASPRVHLGVPLEEQGMARQAYKTHN